MHLVFTFVVLLFLPFHAHSQAINFEKQEDLEISNSKNADLLSKIGEFKNLKRLTVVCLESLENLPNSIGNLSHLEELNMDNGNGCTMNPQLPNSIGNLANLKILNLSGAQDNRGPGKKAGTRRKFPESMSNLINLEIFNIGRNNLTEVPPILKKLSNLRVLILDYNDFSDLPDWLNKMPMLKTISMGSNWKLSCSVEKQIELKKRFSKIAITFVNEYDCPEE
jgi:Leucine-rich repeat (LRR) protein